jgi:hypothetical protein
MSESEAFLAVREGSVTDNEHESGALICCDDLEGEKHAATKAKKAELQAKLFSAQVCASLLSFPPQRRCNRTL